MDIVPARIVAAEVAAQRVEHHDPARIGDGDLEIAPALGEPGHVGLDLPLLQRAHPHREAAIGDTAGLHVIAGQFRQHVGAVDQGVFHRLAHARLDLFDEHPPHQQRRQRDDQEVPQQDAQADVHAGTVAGRNGVRVKFCDTVAPGNQFMPAQNSL